jgi:PAT family beta-lactamase induction signal transducer AmpG
MTEAARGPGLVLTENRTFRLACFFLFYFAQGLPVGLTSVALPAWLASNGAPDAAVAALVATAYLAWSYKFIIAAVMDRYTYLPMGRRRIWLIFAQLLMLVGFLVAAAANPGPHDFALLTWVTLLVMSAAATQDVAVDGMAVDILADREQGTASSFMFGGQALGMAASGAIGGYLLQHYGSDAAFLAFLAPIAVITLLALFLRERPGERRFPWSEGDTAPENRDRHVGAWLPILLVTLKSLIKRDSLILLGGSAFFRAAGGMITPLIPILATTMVGYTTATYSGTVSTIDLGLAVVAIGLGSFLTVRLGPKYASILVLLILGGWCAYTLLGKGLWLTTAGFLAGYVVYSLFTTLSSVTTNPLRMQLSDPRVAATQFTIYNSLSNLPVSLGATLFGMLGGSKNLSTVMMTTIGMFLVACVVLGFLRTGTAASEPELVEKFD